MPRAAWATIEDRGLTDGIHSNHQGQHRRGAHLLRHVRQTGPGEERLKRRFDEELVFYRSAERGKCFIEYIPAENAWVPIQADGYLHINCLWIAGAMKGHGYSNDLLRECVRDAKERERKGLCIQSDKKFLKLAGVQA